MKKKLRIRILACVLIVVAPYQAVIAGVGTGTITGVLPYSTGSVEIFLIKTSGISGTPSCNFTNRFAIASTNPRYKNTVAALMTAYAAGLTVKVTGLNTCNVWNNSEDIDYVCIGNITC